MSNFDLRKFLAEGKLYEEVTSTEEAMEPSNKQKLINAGYSESDAEDFANEFEQGGVKIPQKVKDILSEKSSSKMKMSDLKKKIRQEILAELDGAETEGPNGENVSPVAEATKDGDGEVPSKDTDTDVDIIDKEKVEVDVEKKPKAIGVDNEFLDQLEDLKDEADEMGDNKLERQIDNTITYFTRQHIAKDTNESIELEEADDMALVADLEALIEGEEYDDYDLNVEFKKSPDKLPYDKVLDIIKSYEDESILDDFKSKFPEGKDISKEDYSDFSITLIDDMSEVGFIQANWISIFDENVFDKAGLVEGYSEFQRVDKGKKKTAAKNKAEEEVYGAGVKKGEKIEKKKLQKESLEILKMKKLAGLLTEGEYAKALLKEAEEVDKVDENIIPSVVDILKDPKLGLKHFAKLDAYDTKFKLKDDSEAIKKNPQLKGKEVEITGYYDPRENLLAIRSGNVGVNVYPEEVEIIASTYTDNKEDYFKKNPKG